MKRTSNLFLAGILVLFFGCHSKENSKIYGNLKSSNHHLEGKMIYLTNPFDHSKLIDSALVKEGQFEFAVNEKYNVFPVRMVLQYYDESHGRYLRRMGYNNPFLAKTVESQFYYEGSDIRLELDTDRTNKFVNNEVVFNFKNMDNQTDIAFRHHHFKKGSNGQKHNLKLIKQYPNSVDLVYQLWSVKEQFSKEDVRELANAFDPSVKRSVDYLDLVLYLNDPLAEANVGEVKYIFVND